MIPAARKMRTRDAPGELEAGKPLRQPLAFRARPIFFAPALRDISFDVPPTKRGLFAGLFLQSLLLVEMNRQITEF